ncbi:transglutaminase-like domain-containing protein [Algoriphagus halophytocola]|uniref:transglutaminase-like domain-containing protein n=1 Tax=Algoriphagus halophytocola TaxID=2991499 RepID=UPI0022DE880B|nr:transglutaminase-like domain-containing protein [Algoriphagus sp. TR-M9]WBL42674.1 transglutaminase-like domain-containing protein [Algoriphagus sp. TR-M9]
MFLSPLSLVNILFALASFGEVIDQNEAIKSNEDPLIYSLLEENQRIEILDNFEVIHKIEQKHTILSHEGLRHAFTSIFYDKLNSIENFQLQVIDPASGKTLSKAKTKDMVDAAIYSRSSIFDDNRHKYYEVKSHQFPVEVHVEIETKASSNFQLDEWVPVHYYNQKVTKSTLTVVYPEQIGLRYKALNLLGEHTEKKNGNQIEMTWVETDLPVQLPDLKKEDDHKLLLAPLSFALGDYVGTMEDWAGLAAWQYKLNEGRRSLSEDFEEKLHEMVAGVESDFEKVQILYDYLQKNYRYVSIQLGIGGWQTMSASDVVSYAYGDCKGLTNLMQAMLKAVNIPSNYTLVYAGENADDIETDLPSNQFNHVILQVPLQEGKDPVWLECTSNSLPAGFLGSFTKNRHVLVITEDGGYLTKTPSYNSFDWNAIHSQNEVKIDGSGNATIATQMKIDGNFAEDLLGVQRYLDSREQKDYLHRNSPVSGLVINEYQLELERKDSLLIAGLSYDGFIQRFVQNTAKRMILKPFLGKLTEDMLVNNSLMQVDEYQIELPEVMEAENLAELLVLDEEGVHVTLSSSLEGKNLSVNREIKLSLSDDFSEEDKEELIRKINALGSTNFYFIKNTSALTHE